MIPQIATFLSSFNILEKGSIELTYIVNIGKINNMNSDLSKSSKLNEKSSKSSVEINNEVEVPNFTKKSLESSSKRSRTELDREKESQRIELDLQKAGQQQNQ